MQFENMIRKRTCSTETITVCSPGTKNNDILLLPSLLEKWALKLRWICGLKLKLATLKGVVRHFSNIISAGKLWLKFSCQDITKLANS